MNEATNSPESTPASTPGIGLSAAPSRRRFLGTGAVVTPAILTLASQPALGVTCFTPSRSLSKNTSASQVGKDGVCLNAESPGNYKEQSSPTTANGKAASAYHWPISPNTKFHSNETYNGMAGVFTGSCYGDRSLLNVLNQTDGLSDPSNVAKHLIGAYLNILGGNGAVIAPNVLNAQGVKNIWSAWLNSSFTSYPVSAGVKWTGDQLVSYLIANGIVK